MSSSRSVHPMSSSVHSSLSNSKPISLSNTNSNSNSNSLYKLLVNSKHVEKYPNKKLPVTTIDIPEVEVVTTGCFIACKLC
jgi:hypothetical protein